ncbi:legume-like lectin family-domain-containing protein [Phellopilus nigrolimitatus]|nr:legume-like lectin family-domain-containing protein [Phellopilus nigrolimitatus]
MLCQLLFHVLVLLLPLGALAAKDSKKDGKKDAKNATIDRLINLRTHSLYAPYIDQDLQNRWWDFGADAIVNTNKHIRLTRARPSQMGWLWSRLPLTATHYVIEVEFKISGDSPSSSSHLHGDGLAIWLAQDRAEPGPVFGSKGAYKFTGLGIFLDTYANARHAYSFPRVVAMLGDGATSYDHDHDGDTTSVGACSANFRRTNVATRLRLTYVRDKFLDVKMQFKAWDDWTDCFRIEGLAIPNAPYIGFSALTGDVFDTHDIISISTSSAILGDPSRPRDRLQGAAGAAGGAGGASASSWLGALVRLFLFAGVCVGALYGYKEYARRNNVGFGAGGGGGFGRGGGYGRGGGFDMWRDGKRF